MKISDFVGGIIIGCLTAAYILLFVLTYFETKWYSKVNFQQEAIIHNAGVYVADKNGLPVFKWNDEL